MADSYISPLEAATNLLVEVSTNPSNQALERTAARRAFRFQMIKTVSVEAALALGGGRSAWSR
jgi:hypothetical protein